MRFCPYRHIQIRGEWLSNEAIEIFVKMAIIVYNVREVSGLP